MKCRDPHTKNLKYCSYKKCYEHKNKFGKGWSTGSELMIGKNNSTLTTLKINLSDHPFIKYDVFEVNVNFPPRDTPIGIVAQYYDNHNMSYINQYKRTAHGIMNYQL